jgi:competence protein ComEA
VFNANYGVGVCSYGSVKLKVIKGLLTGKEQAVLIFLALALVAGSSFLWWDQRRASVITVTHDEESVGTDSPATAADAAEPAAPQSEPKSAGQTYEVVISVAGAVNDPGVYRLAVGSVVEDAVDAAGGYAEDADPAGINRAAKLIDGTTLTVPAKRSVHVVRGSEPVLKVPSPVSNIPAYLPGFVPQGTGQQPSSRIAGAPTSGKININTASSEELQTLPRIGPKLARAIIEYRGKRPFGNIEEIQNVPRIGPKTFEGFKDLITVSDQ